MERTLKDIKIMQKILKWALTITAIVLTFTMAKAMKMLFILMKSEGLL